MRERKYTPGRWSLAYMGWNNLKFSNIFTGVPTTIIYGMVYVLKITPQIDHTQIRYYQKSFYSTISLLGTCIIQTY